MQIARRIATWSSRRLPYDAEVEYLESTGTQWIDTGYRPNSITEFSVDYKPAYYGTTFICVYGAQSSNDRQRFYCVLSGSSMYKIQINSVEIGSDYRIFCGFNTNGTTTNNTNGDFAPDNRRVSMVVNNPQKKVVLNDVEYAMPDWWGVNLSCPDSLALLGRKSEGAIKTANLFIGKIERCNISEGGVLVRDFIPVRFTNEQGVSEGAMFDRANPTVGMDPDGSPRDDGIYRNRGTGVFIFGPDK